MAESAISSTISPENAGFTPLFPDGGARLRRDEAFLSAKAHTEARSSSD
jgi:hypothetical protein